MTVTMIICLLDYAKYVCPLLFAFHPFPSPFLQLDAQGESTFLLVEVTGIPSVPMQPRKTSSLSEKCFNFFPSLPRMILIMKQLKDKQ